MTTATATKTADHYILIERNGHGRQNWKSTPYYEMQDALEARDRYAKCALPGVKHLVKVVFTDGTHLFI